MKKIVFGLMLIISFSPLKSYAIEWNFGGDMELNIKDCHKRCRKHVKKINDLVPVFVELLAAEQLDAAREVQAEIKKKTKKLKKCEKNATSFWTKVVHGLSVVGITVAVAVVF